MKVLWISAHPEPASLNGSLRMEGIEALKAGGHEVVESDLYAMGFNPVVTGDDYQHDPAERLVVGHESKRALLAGELSADIRAEHDKLAWADTIVVQFPLWWYGMPAIMKGWFDRVFVQGYAYGVKDPDTGRTRRYGDGGLAGKRALIVTTVGVPGDAMGPRSIHGGMDDVLFTLTHGTLWYAGIEVVEPLAILGANRMSGQEYRDAADELRERLLALPTAEPIPFRRENSDDYDENLNLRADLAPGRVGGPIHRRDS